MRPYDPLERPCQAGGGEYRMYPSGGPFCHDECNKPPPGRFVCTAASSAGCDCGPNRCWDGTSCR